MTAPVSGAAGDVPAAEAPASQSDRRSANIEFRKNFGLPYDEASLAAAEADRDPGSWTTYGVPLTAPEFADQQARDERQRAHDPLLATVDEHDDELAGVWIDQANDGEYVVMALPSMSAATREEVTAKAPRGATLLFVDAQFSGAELKAAAKLITAEQGDVTDPAGPRPDNVFVELKSHGFTITTSGVQTDTNRVGVGFERIPSDRVSELNSTWDDAAARGVLPSRDLVTFEETGAVTLTDTRPDSPGELKGGLWIDSNTGVGCTMSNTVVVPNGPVMQMSAAHCFPLNSTATHAGVLIGTTVRDAWYNNSTADASGIQADPAGWGSPDMMTVFTCPAGACPQVDTANLARANNMVTGERVCMGGRTTNITQCGSITDPSRSVTVSVPNRGSNTFLDQVGANYPSAAGDSGATVGNGGVVFGINSSLAAGTAYFSKMQNAINELGGADAYMITAFSPRNWSTEVGMFANKCIDVNNNNPANGTPLVSWSCNGNPAQQWEWVPTPGPQGNLHYVLRRAALPSKCMDLDIAAGGQNNGAKIQEWDCNGQNNQKWRLVRRGHAQPWYQAISLWSGKCVDLDLAGGGSANGARIQQWTCLGTGQTNQYWRIG